MKVVLIALLFAVPAFAQTPSSSLPAACGPEKVTFKATVDDTRQAPAQPAPGSALVYIIQDNGTLGDGNQHDTLRIGLDGAWAGAYKNNSYFAVSVGPGEHHVCANVQSNFSAGQLVVLAHFTAEAGKVYYFRTRFLNGITLGYPPPPYLDLDPVDNDQGKYLIASYPLSMWKTNK